MNETFTGIDLTLEHPPGICPQCAAHGLGHMPSGIVFAHCEHHMTGVFRHPGESWTRREEIGAADFQTAILTGAFAAELIACAAATDGMTKQ